MLLKWQASLIIVVGSALLACSSELSRDKAERDIGERIAATAELELEEVAPATSVQVVEILQPSDARRIVHFQFVKGSQESEVFDANYVRSDDGWSMTDFDSGAVDLVTSIRVAGLVTRSADLIVALDHLGAAVREWRGDQPFLEDLFEGKYELKWPTRSELEVYSERPDLPGLSERADLSTVRWGVSPEKKMFWVEDVSDDSRACVWPNRDSGAIDRFLWIMGDGPQCMVEGVWFKPPLGAWTVKAEVERIVRRGEIWLN